MWNHQKLLILFFCIATVCVQSIRAGLKPSERKFIADVKKHLENAEVPDGRIDYFRHWKSWEKTDEEFRNTVAKYHKKNFKNYSDKHKGIPIKALAENFAYEALDVQAKLFMENFKTKLGQDQDSYVALEGILNNGQFLHFNAFLTDKYFKDGRLMEINSSMLTDYVRVCNKEFNNFQIISREQMKKFADFESLLQDAAVPMRRINYFRHWRSWEKATDQFKFTVETYYHQIYDHNANSLQYQKESVENLKKQAAYEALDIFSKQTIGNFKMILGQDQESNVALDGILNGGRFLHFEAFLGKKYLELDEIPKDDQSLAELYKNVLTQYLQDDFGLSEAIFEEEFRAVFRPKGHKKLSVKFDKILNLGYSLQFRQFLEGKNHDVNNGRPMKFEPDMVDMYLSHFEITL